MRICGPTRVVVGLLLLAAIPAAAAGGFYLIAPPGDAAVNLSAPLSSWERRGSYDTSAACFDALNGYRIETRTRLQGSSLGPEQRHSAAALEHLRATSARCVYANDPRLR